MVYIAGKIPQVYRKCISMSQRIHLDERTQKKFLRFNKYFLNLIFFILLFWKLIISPVFGTLTLTGNSTLSSSLNDLALTDSGGDWRYFAFLAYRLDAKSFDESDYWIYHLWPPGMPWLHLSIEKFLPTDLHVLKFSILLLAINFFIFFIMTKTTESILRLYLGSLLFFSLFFNIGYTDWIIGEFRLYSEGFAIATMLLGLQVLVLSAAGNSTSTKLIIFSGILLGISSFFRATMDSLTFFTLVAVILVSSIIIIRVTLALFLNKYKLVSHVDKFFIKALKIILSGVIISLLLTLPWRIYKNIEFDAGWAMASTSSRTWINQWVPNNMYAAGPWTEVYGSNGLCQAYPRQCMDFKSIELSSQNPYSGQLISSQTYREAAFTSIEKNPLPWIISRADFMSNNFLTAIGYGTSMPKFYIMSIILTISLFIIISTTIVRINEINIMIFIWSMIIIVGSVAPLWFGQFEPRYFYYITVGLPILASLNITLGWRNMHVEKNLGQKE